MLAFIARLRHNNWRRSMWRWVRMVMFAFITGLCNNYWRRRMRMMVLALIARLLYDHRRWRMPVFAFWTWQSRCER